MTEHTDKDEDKCGLMDRTIKECAPPVQHPRSDNRCGICGKRVK